MKHIPVGLALGACVVLGMLEVPVAAQTATGALGPIHLTAQAVNMSNIATGSTARVEISVTRWSTPQERAHLITTMMEKGPQTLLSELQKTPVAGRFSLPGLTGPDPHNLRLGHDIHYAWQTTDDSGGRRVVLITDRYIGFNEARNQPRTIDYPFTLMEIRLDKGGRGEGKMAVATMITFDKKQNAVTLENYASEPVRLQNVTLGPSR